jgi:peptidoglycan/xylan/chitin deacetylase (PgdA/CDA1 family)
MMAHMWITLGVLVAAAALLHVVWRLRHGYPPESTPHVLCFHKISGRFLFEGTWTTPERFDDIIRSLVARGYTFIDEDAYLAALDHPSPDAARQIFLTFDDGYAETIEIAHGILAPLKIPFHVFFVSDYAGKLNSWDLSLGRPGHRHLSWERVGELARAGVSFGSHTASHQDATRLSDDELLDELSRSCRDIEAATGHAVRTLSYPFGRYNARVEAAARSAGFEAAFSLYPKGNNARVDRFALRRDAVYVIDSTATIARKLERNAFYGLEEMKCRAINAVAVLTPLLKSSSARGER